MKETRRAWKVCRQDDEGRLWSLITAPHLAVEYGPGETIRGPYGPLMCFDKQLNARLFTRQRPYYTEVVLLDVGVELFADPQKFPPSVLGVTALSKDILRSFWKGEWRTYKYAVDAPEGTLLCKSVTLDKPIAAVWVQERQEWRWV